MQEAWVVGCVQSKVGPVPEVSTVLRLTDHVGHWKARWAIGRMGYSVPPGLYAVGAADEDSPVFVSANYKMSFDRLREQLGEIASWILVLDTRGINVWCAAGKGTFGTDEIVERIAATSLAEVVSHRTLVLPQLGAPGVRAHEVQKRTGFKVVYGPVRAADLPAFMAAGMEATPEMRRVRFPMTERVALVPVELAIWGSAALLAAAVLIVLSGLGREGFSVGRSLRAGPMHLGLFAAAYVAGAAMTPTLLPWLPGRSFALKGALVGVLPALLALWLTRGLDRAAWLVLAPTVASFMGMNFTGASTFTSLSGVRREMRIAVPIQIAGAVVGVGLWLAARFM